MMPRSKKNKIGNLERYVREVFYPDYGSESELLGAMLAKAERCDLFVPFVKEKYGVDLPKSGLLFVPLSQGIWFEMIRAFDAAHSYLYSNSEGN